MNYFKTMYILMLQLELLEPVLPYRLLPILHGVIIIFLITTLTHQHLGEIGESLKSLQSGFSKELFFMPNRGNFSRGIFATVYTKFNGSLEEAKTLFNSYYEHAVLRMFLISLFI